MGKFWIEFGFDFFFRDIRADIYLKSILNDYRTL